MKNFFYKIRLKNKKKITTNQLRKDFGHPPFSVIDTRTKDWMDRKRWWISLGIKGKKGRDVISLKKSALIDKMFNVKTRISVFDPHLCEVIYRWFAPEGGTILDPFAGGSVRGIVANYMDYKYTGIDIRPEQIEEDIEQAKDIIPDKMPNFICGDSLIELDNIPD